MSFLTRKILGRGSGELPGMLNKSDQQNGKLIVYSVQKVLNYDHKKLFAVTADVDNYYHFVPWCVGSEVFEKTRKTFVRNGAKCSTYNAELVVGFRGLNERYTSLVSTEEYKMVKSEAENTRMFKRLNSTWTFIPLDKNDTQSDYLEPETNNIVTNPEKDIPLIEVYKEDPMIKGYIRNHSIVPSNPVIEEKYFSKMKEFGSPTHDTGKEEVTNSELSTLAESSKNRNEFRTLVKHDIEFEFTSALYSHISRLFFDQITNNIIEAFEKRCKKVLG